MEDLTENYKKYRWFFTSSGKLVVGGKSAVQNEQLLHLIKKSEKDLIVMHTLAPGSPFSVIVENSKNVSKSDIGECAIFTACFSQQWKSGKKMAEVDIFKSNQLNKPKTAKIGTWQVKGEVETIVVPLELYLTKQEGVLRAVPKESVKKPIVKILPGKIDKADILSKIQISTNQHLSQEELLSALPAGGIDIKLIGDKK